MRSVVTFTGVLELQKLGNVPNLLRKAANRYETAVQNGNARAILSGGVFTIALNDGDDITTARSRITLQAQEIELPDLTPTP